MYSGGTGRPYLVEGVGEDFWPTTYDPTVCDEIIAITDARSFEVTRMLARQEGLLVGGSCGMAVAAALELVPRLAPTDVVVVLLPDGGRGYLSKIFSDTWMSDYGFLQSEAEITVGQVLRGKSGETPQLVHGHPNETIREAIDILREYSVSQMPVVNAEPPVTAGEVVGSVSERALLDALFAGTASLADALDHQHGRSAADHRFRRAGLGRGPCAGEGGRVARPHRRQAGRRAHPSRPARLPRRALNGSQAPRCSTIRRVLTR